MDFLTPAVSDLLGVAANPFWVWLIAFIVVAVPIAAFIESRMNRRERGE